MITVKRLRELLARVPDDAMLYGYEGEGTGIGVYIPSGTPCKFAFIYAGDDRRHEDDQPEFDALFPPKEAA